MVVILQFGLKSSKTQKNNLFQVQLQNLKLSELGEFWKRLFLCMYNKKTFTVFRLLGKVTTNNPQINLLDLNTEFHVSYLETISLYLYQSTQHCRNSVFVFFLSDSHPVCERK